MLILSRRAGEAIRIGGGIRLVVIKTDHGGVRIGIEAPADVSILREELVLEVESENLRARAEHSRSLKDLMGAISDEPSSDDEPSPDDDSSST